MFLSSYASFCILDSCWHVYIVQNTCQSHARDPFPWRKLKEYLRICHLSPRRHVMHLYNFPADRGILCTASKSHTHHSHITSITTFSTSDMAENMIPHQLCSQLWMPEYTSFQPSKSRPAYGLRK